MHLDKHIVAHRLFISLCPVISNITLSYGGIWPAKFSDLLSSIIEKCQAPFTSEEIDQVENAGDQEDLQFWQLGHWFPHWPRLRKGKQYSNYYTKPPTTTGKCLLARCFVTFFVDRYQTRELSLAG